MKGRSFGLDLEHGTFVLDGQPFRFISGTIHNYQVPSGYWNDRFRKIRACGLNAVQVQDQNYLSFSINYIVGLR